MAKAFKASVDKRRIVNFNVIHTRQDWCWCVFIALKTHQDFAVTWGVLVRLMDEV